jgi:hypothetical protein
LRTDSRNIVASWYISSARNSLPLCSIVCK